MSSPVKPPTAPRTRRAERAERTRRRIVEAATSLFDSRGYAATTIEAIAEQADVAAETVYSRFRTKANLLDAILEPAIVGVNQSLVRTHFFRLWRENRRSGISPAFGAVGLPRSLAR